MGCTLNRAAYERLIAEDLEWLMAQTPRTLERDHIEQIVRRSTESEYGKPDPPEAERQAAGWADHLADTRECPNCANPPHEGPCKRKADPAEAKQNLDAYHWEDGSLKWGDPIDVHHLILQLQTLEPAMKVSSVTFIEIGGQRKARAYGLSMSRERWDENGWLNFKLPGPMSLAIWANQAERVEGVNGPDRAALDELLAAAKEAATDFKSEGYPQPELRAAIAKFRDGRK